jgi:hypothetical protein
MPVPTLAEVLKQSGWTQTQIDALDAQSQTGLTNYVTNVYQTAEQKEQAATAAAAKAESDRKAQEAAVLEAKSAQEAAEFAKRNVDEFWATTYPTSLTEHNTALQEEKTARINAEAKAAWLQAQVDGAKAAGITLADAPAFTPPARPAPVVNPNTTPGTPTFVDPNVVVSRVGDGMYNVMNIMHKYSTLYDGQQLPIAPSELIKQADALKLSPMEYAARTYKFAEKEAEKVQAAAKAHDDAIAAASSAAKDAEWKAKMDAQSSEFAAKERKMAEQLSTHPDMHLPQGSARITELRRATSTGERPDPTKLTPEARLKLSQENIRKRVEERQSVAA